MLIHEITLRGILSFGPDTPPLPMRPLNVLIGPNGSGKSNLISAIDFMRSSPDKLTAPIRDAGGILEWIWKGNSKQDALVELVLADVKFESSQKLRHRIEFARDSDSRFEVIGETVADSTGDRLFYSRTTRTVAHCVGKRMQSYVLKSVARSESILSQLKDPGAYPFFAQLTDSYDGIRLHREWTLGRNSIYRSPQPGDAPSDQLQEDFSNLGLFLNHLRRAPKAKIEIIEHLRDLYAGLDDFDVRIAGGTVEIFLTEGDFVVPASRLSDGTLRYLCLLAILCNPNPPGMICLEEPELGLHPDMIPKIADLLIAASQRTQLIVTTHSDILIDALTEQPESVVVMEKKDGKTTATRLQASEELQGWLQSYRLGQLWMRGAIGGTRW